MDNLSHVESIFFGALEKDATEERSAYLDEACGQDADLRTEVERLLEVHPDADSFLKNAAGYAPTIDTSAIAESAGTVIGPYKLLQQIGEGGMGIVWMAEQTEPVRRQVALKIIKPGMDSSQVIARFEAERQALAMMDHPNIAKVLDAGTVGQASSLPSDQRQAGSLSHAGRPYFVMELVKGVPIMGYCDQQRLSPAERLELFIPVCEAIQHAHQKGIIHRDIKPSNVLIASYDGRPVPKVIDFGVAKAMGQKLTERTLFTGFGGIVGTLEYMSPEQAEFNALDIDTRSDIYSLGVLLYELLTGSTPLTKERLKDAAITELLRVIREEEPPPPSTRLSQSGESLASISDQRKSDVQRLPKLVRGELDWIVMKALEKDRTRRYETANGMARDIEHYLHNEPVEACPPSAVYRLRKFVRRNKGTVVAVSLIILILLTGVTVATWQAVRAWRAERVATVEQQKAKKAADKAIAEKDRADANAKRADANAATARRNLYAAHMNLAQDAWKDSNVVRAVELLKEQKPREGQEDLRSFEWRYLWRQTHLQKKTLKIAAANEQAAMVAISPDGRWLAAGIVGPIQRLRSGHYTLSKIKLWDLTTGTLRHTFADPSDDQPQTGEMDKMYEELVFSGDGKLFATVEFDHVMVWQGDENARTGHWEMRNPRITIWDLETMTLRNTIRLPAFALGDWIAISADSKRIATACHSIEANKDENPVCTIAVWDIPEQPDGDKPAAGKETFLWHVERKPGDNRLISFAFSPDNQSVLWRITNTNNGALMVANVSGEGQSRSLPIDAHGLTFSPDGKYIAGSPYVWDSDTPRAGGWRMVRLFDANSGETVHDFPLTPMGNWFEARATFSPDGRMLAVRRGATLQVWDVESKEQVGDVRGNTANILAVGFGPDSRTVITVSQDKQAKVWEIHSQPGPDEFSLGKGPKRKMWKKASEREHNVISGMNISSDGKTLFTSWSSLPSGPETRVVTLTDLAAESRGKRISELPIDPALNWIPERAAFAPDGRWMAMTGRLGHRKIQLWQLHGGDGEVFKPTFDRDLPALQFMSNRVPSVVFSPDGKKLVYAGGQGDGRNVQGDLLFLVDIASGKETQLPADLEAWFAHARGIQGVGNDEAWEGECCGVAVSSDSQHVFSVHKRYTSPWDTRIIAWDPATLRVLAVLEATPSLNRLWQTIALSHDDRLLATCQDDHSIFLWDVSEPELQRVHDELERRAAAPKNKPSDPAAKPLAEMRGHSNLITAVTFHPDGKTLASASHDRTIKLWDVATGELRLTLEGHEANIIALAFTPDGNTLISADNSGTVKLWRAAAESD